MMKYLLAFMLLTTQALADLEYTWTAPTTGAKVEFYEAQRQSWRTGTPDTNLTFVGAFEDTVLTMPYVEGYCVQVRVRGVGELESGPWSPWSTAYCGIESITPGAVGQPVLVRVVRKK